MDVRDNPRAKQEKSDTLIQLCYPKCELSDTGTYSIRIVNDFGSASVDLRLKVVDCPALPEGSLKEHTASGSGRRRVGSTAEDRPAQAAAAACAAGEEAPDEVDKNEEKRQDMAVVTKRMAILDLSTSGTPARSQVSVVEEPFVVPLKSQRATEKENATFECYVNDKEIDVKWFHDGAKIGMDGRHIKQRAGCRRRLLIINVLFEDHGEYKCTTKDDETMAQLIVDPKFIKKKRSASR
ncbi:hypothetical protein niasHT_029163 [Heterodera trifolii]|uniref:Ig-like domain-containing protein n=1 Tax=Heterodera trifolii TaxID=157864 RepID=A0ABD2JYE6_9BILA